MTYLSPIMFSTRISEMLLSYSKAMIIALPLKFTVVPAGLIFGKRQRSKFIGVPEGFNIGAMTKKYRSVP